MTVPLAEVLCITGMRIAEALSLNRAQIDWETQTAQIVGKGNKPRKVYFTPDSALAWICQYLDIRHDEHPALFVTQGDNANTTECPRDLEAFSSLCKAGRDRQKAYPHMLRQKRSRNLTTHITKPILHHASEECDRRLIRWLPDPKSPDVLRRWETMSLTSKFATMQA